MKRFTNDKLHEFVMKKYFELWEHYGTLNALSGKQCTYLIASENDIAGYLQDELKIRTYYRTQQWYCDNYHRAGEYIVSSNISRTQAIFDTAEKILEEQHVH